MRKTLRRLITQSFIAALLLAAPAYAQNVGSGSIAGKVTDETGGAMPGVTVNVTSPALQVRETTAITDAAGDYRFVDLPAGTYSLSFTLSGFQTVVRDNYRLNVGFAAKLDVTLKVGALEERITVSGQSPVVDAQTTTGSTNFTKEMLDTIPTTKSIYEVMAMTPGVRYTGAIDVGSSQLGNQQGFKNYGTSGQVTPQLEGLNTRNGSDGSAFFLDIAATEEVQIKAVAADAEVALPGATWVAIVKSGGNEFHGTYSFAGQHSKFQSANVDDALRANGVTSGNAMKNFRDFSGDLGGRIVRDKLWFYGALRDQRVASDVIGYAKSPGPDGVYLTGDDVAGESRLTLNNQTVKMSYQPTRSYKVVGFYQRNGKFEPERFGGRFTPFEATNNYIFIPSAWKGELQGTPSDKLLFTAFVGWEGHLGEYNPQEDAPGKPGRLNRENGLATGQAATQDQRYRSRYQSAGSVSIFPTGSFLGRHSVKIGYTAYLERQGNAFTDRRSGNYRLIYDRVGGVANQPSEIDTYNNPIEYPQNRLSDISQYVKDTWTMKRVTANLGVRFEYYHSFTKEQTKPQGQFGNSGTFPPVDVQTWKAIVPRIGLSWDVTGDAKNVAKLTYGRYNHSMADDFAGNYNLNTQVTTSYRWRDLDGNNDYTPGEVDLNTNGGLDFLRVSGATNNILNPDLGQPATHEFSAGFERELVANFSARALYVYKRQVSLFDSVNVLRPYGAWNIPITRRDPGPDGVLGNADDAGAVSLFDYSPAFRGAAFVGNEFLNRDSDRFDSYDTIEATVNKRLSNRWGMLGSVAATKNHRWIVATPQSPNDEFFPIDETWDWSFKLTGSYEAPYRILIAGFIETLAGTAGQRTYIFRSADPDGGRALTQAGTVTLRLEEFGAVRTPAQTVANLRAARNFDLGHGRRFNVAFDLFNALNANTATTVTYASGPSYGAITRILPPRIARLGVTFGF